MICCFFIMLTNKSQLTALFSAIDNKETETVINLLKEAKVDAKDDNGKTALMYALDMMNTEIIGTLVDAGANVDAKDSNGKTVLMYAIETMNPEICNKFINENTDINAKDNYAKTLLMYALETRDLELSKMLIDKGANVDAKDYNGKTVLMYALDMMNTEIIGNLVDKGANVNATDDEDKTVLMYAIETMNPEICKKFINENTDINAKDKEGKTAVDYAFAMMNWFEEPNTNDEEEKFAKDLEEYYVIINMLVTLEIEPKLGFKKVTKIREALLSKLRPIKTFLQKQDICGKFNIHQNDLVIREKFEQIKKLYPTIQVTEDDENFYLNSGLFEKLHPYYYWKGKPITNNEHIIKAFAKKNSIDTKAYKESTFSFDSVGNYIMYSGNHFSAIKISDDQCGQKQVEIFDSIDTSQMRMLKTVSGFNVTAKLVERTPQKLNQCWGRAFLYLSKDLSDVEDNNSNKYMYENYFSKEEFLCYLDEHECDILIEDLCKPGCHRTIKEMKDISEIFKKHASNTTEAPMLQITIMEKLVSYHNSSCENESHKIQIAYISDDNSWKIRKNISCVSNFKHEDLMALLTEYPILTEEFKDEGISYYFSKEEHEKVNTILKKYHEESKKCGL